MATINLSDSYNLIIPDGLEGSIQALVDSVENSVDVPLSDVDFSGLTDGVIAALEDGTLSTLELTALAFEALDLFGSLGITNAEALVIFSALEDLVDATNTLDTADALIGTTENDVMYGGLGNDTLTGTAVGSTGIGEIDVLLSGGGSDVLVLGDSTGAFYDDGNATTAGTEDYAIIADFNVQQDVIQLNGVASEYVLADVTETLGVAGTGIFYNPSGIPTDTAELVGVVTGVTLTTFDTGFSFVPTSTPV